MPEYSISYTSNSPQLRGSGNYTCSAKNWFDAIDNFRQANPLLAGLDLSRVEIGVIVHRAPSYGSD